LKHGLDPASHKRVIVCDQDTKPVHISPVPGILVRLLAVSRASLR
jgi:hypothetical protein